MAAAERFLVLDCDGVILESNAAKAAGFARVFSDWPEHVPAILALHERYGGVSRYKKFEWIYRDILRQPLSADLARRLGAAYSRAVLAEVLAAPEVPGLRALLDDLRQRDVPVFVLSGTPQDELVAVLDRRDLLPFFTGVVGSPTGKPEALRDLLASAHGRADGLPLFLGDALSDLEAAHEAGVHFLGRVPEEGTDPFPAGTVTMTDLRGYARARDRLLDQARTALATATGGTA